MFENVLVRLLKEVAEVVEHFRECIVKLNSVQEQ